MSDDQTETTKDEWLRLGPVDVQVVWGILDGYKEAMTMPWPSLDRILSDLETMMRKQKSESNG